MKIVEFFERNPAVVVRVHLHVLFSLLVYFIHQLLVNWRQYVFFLLPLEVTEHMFNLVKLNLVPSLQKVLHFFRLDLTTLISVNVLENPLAQGFQPISVLTDTYLTKVKCDLLIQISDRHYNA